MEVATSYFPAQGLRLSDAVSTWAGVRPVIGRRRADPSRESREGLLVDERGLISVTGGKLTTVRATALAAIERVRARCPEMRALPDRTRLFDEVDDSGAGPAAFDPAARRRLLGRHGQDAAAVLAAAGTGELSAVAGTPTLWAELRWAARAEGVTHLDDLLLRRVRLGLVLPEGGESHLPRVRSIVQGELRWSDDRWSAEEAAYRALWRDAFSVPTA